MHLKRLLFVYALAALLVAPSTFAQCPAIGSPIPAANGTTVPYNGNPLTLLTGGTAVTWTFKLAGGSSSSILFANSMAANNDVLPQAADRSPEKAAVSPSSTTGFYLAGQFSAAIGAPGSLWPNQGMITLLGATPNPGLPYHAGFTVNADCSGGTLSLTPYVHDVVFYFTQGFTTLYLVGDGTQTPPSTGIATRF